MKTPVTTMLMLLTVHHAIAIIPCTVINSTLVANETINTSCTSVAFVNVVAQGKMKSTSASSGCSWATQQELT